MFPPFRSPSAGLVTLAIAAAVALPLTGCENPQAPGPDPDPPTQLEMMQSWYIMRYAVDEAYNEVQSGAVTGAGFGPIVREFGPTLTPPIVDDDGIAVAEVYAADTGTPYWVSAQAPSHSLAQETTVGGVAAVWQDWEFRKDSPGATLAFTISAVELSHLDDNLAFPREVCSWGWNLPEPVIYELCRDVIVARVNARYMASVEDPNDGLANVRTLVPFFAASGRAKIAGFANHIDPLITVGQGWGGGEQLFSPSNFDLLLPSTADQRHILRANRQIRVEVPLDTLPLGTEFQLHVYAEAEAWSRRQNESYAAAYFRDPIDLGGGLSMEYSGLTPLPSPDEDLERRVLYPPAPPCVGGGTGGGTIEFDSDVYFEAEWPGDEAEIAVRRQGGSGPASVLLTTSGGTATEGDDYEAVTTHVWFSAGETGTRWVDIPILPDGAAEPEETVLLTLSDPSGCAGLGSRTTAQLNIMDDDGEIPLDEGYTIGGSVTGLEGSGLVLTNLSTDHLAISGNGAFEFDRRYPGGHVYQIRVDTQPTDPAQLCAVANGSGTVGNDDVTDVLVTCETLEPVGDVDLSFGSGGLVTLDVGDTGFFGEATDVALQADGKLLVAGGNTVARYNADGTLDAGFGAGGTVQVDFYGATNDILRAIAVAADGTIYVAGESRDGVTSPVQEDFIVASFLADGTSNTMFGVGGEVVTDFDSHGDSAYDVHVQPDGNIVVTGGASTDIFGFGTYQGDFAAVRYTPAGELDPTFGNGGRATANVGGNSDHGYSSALQADGRIVMAGRVAPSGGADPDFGIVRFNADGTLDSGFGSGGIVRRVTDGWDQAGDVAVAPDGRIVVVGFATSGGAQRLVIERLNADGSFDLSFGSAGRVESSAMDEGRAVALLSDGSMIVGGELNDASNDFALAGFGEDGAQDASFGTEGRIQVDFHGGIDYLNAIVIQPDGRIVAAGEARNGAARLLGLVRAIP